MGGFLAVSTTIHGTVGAPGIPFSDSPSGGIYETDDGGVGISLSGNAFFELNQLNFLLGLKPSINESFALAEATSSPYTYGAISPNGVAVSPDNMHVYFATSVAAIYGYSRNVSNNVLTILPGFPLADASAISIIITPDGKQVVLGTTLGARVYDRNSLTGALTFNVLHADGNFGTNRGQLTISADGLFIYAGSQTAIAQYSRNALTGVWTFLGTIVNATNSVGGVALAPNGKFLAAIDGNGWLYIYPRNTATGILSAATSIIATPGGLTGGVVISPDSEFVYFSINGYPAHNAQVYSVDQASFKASLIQTYVVGGVAASGNPQSTGMSIDGSRLYFGMSGGDGVYVASRNATTGRLVALATFVMANNGGNAVVESPDGNMLVVSSGNPSAVNQIDVLNTSANLRHNLLEVIFDRTGVSGSVGINGTLNVFGSSVLSEAVADARYIQSGLTVMQAIGQIGVGSASVGCRGITGSDVSGDSSGIFLSGFTALGVRTDSSRIQNDPAGNMGFWIMNIGSMVWRKIATVNQLGGISILLGGLLVNEGANGKQGIAALVAGTVTIANTSITANSRIMISVQETGILTGSVRVSARVVGTSFTISSSVATDTATVAYEIFEPA